jgi:hypothetical protein
MASSSTRRAIRALAAAAFSARRRRHTPAKPSPNFGRSAKRSRLQSLPISAASLRAAP